MRLGSCCYILDKFYILCHSQDHWAKMAQMTGSTTWQIIIIIKLYTAYMTVMYNKIHSYVKYIHKKF